MDLRKGSVEGMAVNKSFWSGKRVFITGHTGFKGGWLALWLSKIGAEVHGYALAPSTDPNFFSMTGLEECLASSTIADIRDTSTLNAALHSAAPEIVLHLAAQPLVRYSYVKPVETYAVNVMGSVNLFEAVRNMVGVRAVVNVTTD
jgi:CDP-glucose 4,6-dehydratase